MELQDGWVVNLGIGFPTLCSNYLFGDKTILLRFCIHVDMFAQSRQIRKQLKRQAASRQELRDLTKYWI